MRAVVQRVRSASVRISGDTHAAIDTGLLVFLGIEHEDGPEDVEWLSQKILQLRIMEDAEGRMNVDLPSAGGALLVVSQFTLHASTRKGNRPSFIRAARPEHAIPLYEAFLEACRKCIQVESGSFGAHMEVALVNDGPVTIWIDSRNRE